MPSHLENLRVALRPLLFAVLAGSQILDVFNVTGVTFALPSIAEKFSISEAEASWVLSAYSLTFGSFLLIAGRLGDIIGHHNVYSIGILLFAICSGICAGIDNVIGIYVVRAFQEIFAACTIPTSYALVATTYQGKSQKMAVSALGACQAIGAVAGTIVGGVFTTISIGYRGLFWLSFALGMTFAALSFLLITPTPTNNASLKKLDYPGAFFITAGSLLLVFGFTEAVQGWSQPKVIATIILGASTIAFFIFWEEFVLEKYLDLEPLIPRKVWSFPNFSPIVPITGFTYATFFIILLNGSQFLIRVQGKSYLTAAIEFLPTSIITVFAIAIIGSLYGKVPPKWVIAGGELFVIAGEILFSRNGVHTSFWRYTFSGQVLLSLGVSGFFVNYLNVAISSAPNEVQGLIAGILQTMGQLGTALGFAIASSQTHGETPVELLRGYRNSFYTAVAFAAVGLVIAVIFINSDAVPVVVGVKDSDLEDSSVVPGSAGSDQKSSM